MKIIQAGVILATVSVMLACGNNTKKNISTDNTSNSTDSVTVTDSLKVKAGSYTNKKLRYRIKFPAEIFTPQEDHNNPADCNLVPKEGTATMRIYKDERKDKSGNILGFNEAYKVDDTADKSRQISYSFQKPLFYVICGVEGDRIFYQKTILRDNSIVTAKLTYTKEEKPTYDPMITSLFDSFE